MSQATLIGLCSDNLITILQPSSTIECTGSDAYRFDVSATDIPVTGSILIPSSGNGFLSGTVTVTVDGVGTVTVNVGGFTTTTAATAATATIPFQTFMYGDTAVLLTLTASNCTITSASVSYKVLRR